MKLRIREDINIALKEGKPVVALESTIISHGMPYPKNVETALRVEQEIINNGAIPATIGIIDGECVVGLSNEEIELFGSRKGVLKVSRRDLPIVIAKKEWGATTVATTMIIANLAGIKTFVTGGIGGVHRGYNETMDVSADLQELAQTNVAVICAGIKSILDLPRTLEYLETMGVPVLGYKTPYLPAFYTKNSGLKLDAQIDSPLEAAQIMKEKWDLKLNGGLLIANPIPDEYSMNQNYINNQIEIAIEAMNKEGIKGKDCTPFLLSYIKNATQGKSLDSNIELVLNNARVGAKIAVEFSKL